MSTILSKLDILNKSGLVCLVFYPPKTLQSVEKGLKKLRRRLNLYIYICIALCSKGSVCWELWKFVLDSVPVRVVPERGDYEAR